MSALSVSPVAHPGPHCSRRVPLSWPLLCEGPSPEMRPKTWGEFAESGDALQSGGHRCFQGQCRVWVLASRTPESAVAQVSEAGNLPLPVSKPQPAEHPLQWGFREAP